MKPNQTKKTPTFLLEIADINQNPNSREADERFPVALYGLRMPRGFC